MFPKPDSSYITASPGSSQEGVKHLTPFTFDSENRDFLLSLSAFDVKRRAKVNCLNPSNFSLNHFRGIKNFLTHTEKQPGTQGGLFEATSTSTTCWEETGDEETYRVSVIMSLNHLDVSKMRRAAPTRSYMPLFFFSQRREESRWWVSNKMWHLCFRASFKSKINWIWRLVQLHYLSIVLSYLTVFYYFITCLVCTQVALLLGSYFNPIHIMWGLGVWA